jgi:hypothetical protein
MSTLALRERLVEIAERDVGGLETSRNRGPAIRKFWPATNYPDGYANREPYCAAAVCYWVQQWLADSKVAVAVCEQYGLLPSKLNAWRCKSAAAFGWIDWAKRHDVAVLSDSSLNRLRVGDIMVFDMSHIGIVTDDAGNTVYTIEANTGATGGRDGDGIFTKSRHRSLARGFIRILQP